jgi:1,2-diacylglycerol-3-alpha-glucose alpha-1,2-galactosyltransferase
MSVLEAFSCGTPVMLRDLDLYHSIIQGYYEPAKDVDEMQQKLDWLQKTPARLAELKMAAHTASRQYSKSHLAKVWHQFYLEQAKEG